jgi:hypothetical protein
MNANPKLSQVYHWLTSQIEQHRKLVVFCLSAVGGAVMGMWRSDWQVAVEPAQIIAGLVKYPLTNPFYIYQVKTWTILHQLAAIGLRAGLSEGKLSLIFSALAGALAFAGIALWTLAFSESIPLAILVPFYVYQFTPDWGINYPLILVGQGHTYGMLGLSSIFLATALFGVGEFGWGTFLLALTPAIHPSLGAWGILIVLVCLAWDYQAVRPHLPTMVRFGIAGGLITLISLIFHFSVTYYAPKIDPALAQHYLSTFIRSWDEHRVPVNLLSTQALLTVLAAAISLTGLQFLKETLPVHSRFLLRSLLISTALGLGLILINQFAFRLPDNLLVLMPTRLLNFNNLAYLPVLLGLMWRQRERVWVLANLLLVVGLTYVAVITPPDQMKLFTLSNSGDQMRLFILAGLAFVLVCAWGNLPLSLLLGYAGIALVFQPAEPLMSQGVILTLSFFLVALGVGIIHQQAEGRAFLKWAPLVLLGLNAVNVYTHAYDYHFNVSYFWNTPAMTTEIPPDDGLLLLGTDMNRMQLYSRRPVLLDPGALDMLPYAPEGGPEFERILRDAYGIDFFTAPGSATLGIEPTKTLWQSWTLADWQRVRNEFNVTRVLTSADWTLQLPELLRTSWGHILYQIPLSGN